MVNYLKNKLPGPHDIPHEDVIVYDNPRAKHARGGKVNIEAIKNRGRYGDTEVAHVPSQFADQLDRVIGTTSRNPHTGHREYFLGSLASALTTLTPMLVDAMNPRTGEARAKAMAPTSDPVTGKEKFLSFLDMINPLAGMGLTLFKGHEPSFEEQHDGLSYGQYYKKYQDDAAAENKRWAEDPNSGLHRILRARENPDWKIAKNAYNQGDISEDDFKALGSYLDVPDDMIKRPIGNKTREAIRSSGGLNSGALNLMSKFTKPNSKPALSAATPAPALAPSAPAAPMTPLEAMPQPGQPDAMDEYSPQNYNNQDDYYDPYQQ